MSKEIEQILIEAFWQVFASPRSSYLGSQVSRTGKLGRFSASNPSSPLGQSKTQKEGLYLRFSDSNLALTSNAIDRVFKRFERKFSSMQQFRSDESGKATRGAWGIVYNFRRFGKDAKRLKLVATGKWSPYSSSI